MSDAFELLAVTTRSGFRESYHLGAVAAVDAAGDIVAAHGDAGLAVYGRSANKPLQMVAMVEAGLRLPAPQLAVACGSHTGTAEHVAVVRQILAAAGLDDRALANTPGLPLDEQASRALVRAGIGGSRVHHNCSGKHAAMIRTCLPNEWPAGAGAYLAPAHPLQRRITDTIAELAGGDVVHLGVDGCGAPAHVLALAGLARAFGRLALAPAGSPEEQVRTAMTAHPFLAGGTGRHVSVLMDAVPGVVAKDGAEGVYAVGLPDGRGVAVKIAGGAQPPAAVVMVATLRALGVELPDTPELAAAPVLGHGRPVGEITATFGADRR